MLTVKEFKDLGVEFVEGDVMMSHLLSKEDAEYLNDTYKYDIDGTTSYFAWRPLNTLPDNPKFKFELEGNNGNIVEFTGEQDLTLTYDRSSNGANFAWLSWRPLLDQSALKPANSAAVKPSDDKPVFTQAMADRGELPPVGSYFTVSGLVGECLLIHCGDIIAKFNTGVMPVNKHECKPLDTRTPKQKAVDEALEAIGIKSVEGGNARRWLDMLYDAGKLKC